jgi:hypothetical protein
VLSRRLVPAGPGNPGAPAVVPTSRARLRLRVTRDV